MYFLINTLCTLPFAAAYLAASLQRFRVHLRNQNINKSIFEELFGPSEPFVSDFAVLSTTAFWLTLHLFCTSVFQILSHNIVHIRGSTNGRNHPLYYGLRFLLVHSGVTALTFGCVCLTLGLEPILTTETIWYHCITSVIACAIQLIPAVVFNQFQRLSL